MTIAEGQRYHATIQLRRGRPGWQWRTTERDGRRVLVEAGWQLGREGTSYDEGEWVMIFRGESSSLAGGWIASGDLVDWERVT